MQRNYQQTPEKLLRKIAKKNSYIKTLDDAFKQVLDINRETSFVEGRSGPANRLKRDHAPCKVKGLFARN